ncbi:MAG: DUF1385 domain-containing protein [Clostridia bacterium]|nr:DUF1385 domain-containing protein [Clostridia bacterium]
MKKQKEVQACARKTSIGGQALMEGIMMRGPKTYAMAVRNTKGEIVIEEAENKTAKRPAICRWPIIRGIFGYIDSMVLGYKCLMRSAEISGLEDLVEESPKKKKKREAAEAAKAAEAAAVTEETAEAGEQKPAEAAETPEAETPAATTSEDPKQTPAEEKTDKNAAEEEKKLPAWVWGVLSTVTVVLTVVLSLGLFMYLPSKLYALLAEHVGFLTGNGVAWDSLWKSVFEGVVKIGLIVGYMSLVSLMKDIRRTYMYHGAEHKTIFCYEAGLELTVENVRLQKRFHPRCGTSFLILMLLVSIFISFFIDPITVLIRGEVLPPILRTGLKLLLLPLIVGIGYELIKFAGRHDNWLTRVISAPGVLLQRLTVLEPTDDMIECAIAAVKRVIPEDNSDKW